MTEAPNSTADSDIDQNKLYSNFQRLYFKAAPSFKFKRSASLGQTSLSTTVTLYCFLITDLSIKILLM